MVAVNCTMLQLSGMHVDLLNKSSMQRKNIIFTASNVCISSQADRPPRLPPRIPKNVLKPFSIGPFPIGPKSWFPQNNK